MASNWAWNVQKLWFPLIIVLYCINLLIFHLRFVLKAAHKNAIKFKQIKIELFFQVRTGSLIIFCYCRHFYILERYPPANASEHCNQNTSQIVFATKTCSRSHFVPVNRSESHFERKSEKASPKQPLIQFFDWPLFCGLKIRRKNVKCKQTSILNVVYICGEQTAKVGEFLSTHPKCNSIQCERMARQPSSGGCARFDCAIHSILWRFW